jgi:hypothetical protein
MSHTALLHASCLYHVWAAHDLSAWSECNWSCCFAGAASGDGLVQEHNFRPCMHSLGLGFRFTALPVLLLLRFMKMPVSIMCLGSTGPPHGVVIVYMQLYVPEKFANTRLWCIMVELHQKLENLSCFTTIRYNTIQYNTTTNSCCCCCCGCASPPGHAEW